MLKYPLWALLVVGNRERWPELCFLLHCVVNHVGASLVSGKDGTRMHYGNKISRQRQWDSLGNVLLRNTGSWHSCGSYTDVYHIPKQCWRPSTSLQL